MNQIQLTRLRLLGFLEGLSYIALLGIGMPLKYIYSLPMPNLIIGTIHGILFIAYCIWVLLVKTEYKWSFTKTFWALFASLVPFGTFIADYKIFRKN
jgi:integral membrane protein